MKPILGFVVLLAASSSLGAAALAASTPEEPWKAPARAARRKNPVAADAASLALGKSLYAQECEACHGPAGKGDGASAKDLEKPPGDLSDPAMASQSDGELFWHITEGKKPMPSLEEKLTEEQRWHVVNYVRTFAAPKPTGEKQ